MSLSDPVTSQSQPHSCGLSIFLFRLLSSLICPCWAWCGVLPITGTHGRWLASSSESKGQEVRPPKSWSALCEWGQEAVLHLRVFQMGFPQEGGNHPRGGHSLQTWLDNVEAGDLPVQVGHRHPPPHAGVSLPHESAG